MSYRLGVDIGGTFADFCVLDEATGALSTLKVLSTPATPGAEVIAGLEGVARRFGIGADAIAWFTHGTTVGVNAVIQRKGIRLALFVTRHFRDVLELARLKSPDPYHLLSERPKPLVTRVVIDLAKQIAYRVEQAGDELRVLFDSAMGDAGEPVPPAAPADIMPEPAAAPAAPDAPIPGNSPEATALLKANVPQSPSSPQRIIRFSSAAMWCGIARCASQTTVRSSLSSLGKCRMSWRWLSRS